MSRFTWSDQMCIYYQSDLKRDWLTHKERQLKEEWMRGKWRTRTRVHVQEIHIEGDKGTMVERKRNRVKRDLWDRGRDIETQREGERQRHTGRETDRDRQRERDRQRHTDGERNRYRQREREENECERDLRWERERKQLSHINSSLFNTPVVT